MHGKSKEPVGSEFGAKTGGEEMTPIVIPFFR